MPNPVSSPPSSAKGGPTGPDDEEHVVDSPAVPAPSAKSAARARRTVGARGAGPAPNAESNGPLQNGHASSLTRTWREQAGQGRRIAVMLTPASRTQSYYPPTRGAHS